MGDLRWSRKSTHALSEALRARDIQVGERTVARVLRAQGYSLRCNERRVSGIHPDRNSQFDYIAAVRKDFADAGHPVISVDTKKKELIGNFYNRGRAWRRETTKVSDHDFRSEAAYIINPYGVYDVAANQGMVVVGTSYDTAEFAVASIRKWLVVQGLPRYPGMRELLILCDSGGSNSCRARLWKQMLQHEVCDPFSLKVTVCHYPTGASKYNPVEHRLFSEISRSWQAVPLQTLEVALNYIQTTRTETGLTVTAALDERSYAKGRKISEDAMATVNIRKHDVLPQWNYTIAPSGRIP